MIFALDKFRSYILGSKTVMHNDHAAIRYLMSKPQAKPSDTRVSNFFLLNYFYLNMTLDPTSSYRSFNSNDICKFAGNYILKISMTKCFTRACVETL